jgi:hypothetical protein
LEDFRVQTLRELLKQATELKESATKLIADLNDQLQRSIFLHDDRGVPAARRRPDADRRRKPRS